MCIIQNNDIHEIITYILSLCLPSVKQDLQLQQNIYIENDDDVVCALRITIGSIQIISKNKRRGRRAFHSNLGSLQIKSKIKGGVVGEPWFPTYLQGHKTIITIIIIF